MDFSAVHKPHAAWSTGGLSLSFLGLSCPENLPHLRDYRPPLGPPSPLLGPFRLKLNYVGVKHDFEIYLRWWYKVYVFT